jgi:hypothetical protein
LARGRVERGVEKGVGGGGGGGGRGLIDGHVADFQSPHGLVIVEKRALAKAEIDVFLIQ